MQHVEVVKRFAAPPAQVWRVYTDHEGWTSWAGLGSARLATEGSPDRNGVGAVRCFETGPGSVFEEVLSFEPPKRMTYRVVRGIPIMTHHQHGVALADIEQHGAVAAVWLEIPPAWRVNAKDLGRGESADRRRVWARDQRLDPHQLAATRDAEGESEGTPWAPTSGGHVIVDAVGSGPRSKGTVRGRRALRACRRHPERRLAAPPSGEGRIDKARQTGGTACAEIPCFLQGSGLY